MSPLGDLKVRGDLVIHAAELREVATRSGGPGGQHVNKTSTRVTLRWNIQASACLTPSQRERLVDRLADQVTRAGDLVVHADTSRSQLRNREEARARIAEIVRAALEVQEPRRPTAPSRAARRRRADEKTRRGAVKQSRRGVSSDED